MDLTDIKNVISTELERVDTTLYSLKVQNHIYGCFIVMEDIVQGTLDVSGTTLSSSKFTFDYEKQFSDIGLFYGFAMDTKLRFDDCSNGYKATWLSYFKQVSERRILNEVDTIEDALILIIQEKVHPENAFFVNALETGTLGREWLQKLVSLLAPLAVASEVSETPVETPPIETTALTKAETEKPVKKRRATRRNKHSVVSEKLHKKPLSYTHRHVHTLKQ